MVIPIFLLLKIVPNIPVSMVALALEKHLVNILQLTRSHLWQQSISSRSRQTDSARPPRNTLRAGMNSLSPTLTNPVPPLMSSHLGFCGSHNIPLRFKIPVSRCHRTLESGKCIRVRAELGCRRLPMRGTLVWS